MTSIEIKKELYLLALLDDEPTLSFAIATEAVESDDPIAYIKGAYKDKGFYYNVNKEFFLHHIVDIVDTLENHELQVGLAITDKNYMTELSYMAYQIVLQKMLLKFELITEEEAIF